MQRKLLIALSAGLLLAVFVVFWPLTGAEFISLDDIDYVVDNPPVTAGLTAGSVEWAFTAFHCANWHPLTWISHMVDWELYGPWAGGHHLTNVGLHALGAVLLLWAFFALTGAVYRSALVAALFAFHPLHVESVAWIAERKDVLSTLFLALTLILYARYARQVSRRRLAWVIVAFTLGLLSKPMLVTLPFVLLLLDYWPLGRVRLDAPLRGQIRPLLVEKIPLFALAAASSWVTVLAQSSGGAVKQLVEFPFDVRLANAVVGYARYLVKMLWPVDLAIFYPHFGMPPVWSIVASSSALLAATGLAWRLRRRAPHLVVGWLWYLGTLVPVIGLVQIGDQALADRYTYIPLVGVFVAIVWGVTELLPSRRIARSAAVGFAVVILAALACLSRAQTFHWKTSIAVYEHALNVSDQDDLIRFRLGTHLQHEGRHAEAVERLRDAIRINPSNAEAHHNLGVALRDSGKSEEALVEFREAARLEPGFALAYVNAGEVLVKLGRLAEAKPEFEAALRVEPRSALAHYNLGTLLAGEGRLPEAVDRFRAALAAAPDYADAHTNLGAALYQLGQPDEALRHFEEAARLQPENALARENLEGARRAMGLAP